jgi:hypothetical protein
MTRISTLMIVFSPDVRTEFLRMIEAFPEQLRSRFEESVNKENHPLSTQSFPKPIRKTNDHKPHPIPESSDDHRMIVGSDSVINLQPRLHNHSSMSLSNSDGNVPKNIEQLESSNIIRCVILYCNMQRLV